MHFTPAGFWRGFRMSLPLAVSVFTYGVLFGMLAQKAGMTGREAILMSLTVFAGASQLIATDLWADPLPVVALIVTTFIVNARHLLMGAAVYPWFKQIRPLEAYGSLFFCADENWALAIRQFQAGERDAAFLVGGGVAIYIGWAIATLLGFISGIVFPDPARFGIDFAFTAVFIALLTGMWSGKRDLVPWLIAAVVAVIFQKLVPGKWYILAGALAGSFWVAVDHKES